MVIQELPQANLALFGSVLFLAFTIRVTRQPAAADAGVPLAAARSRRTARRRDPVSTELARTRALKMPFYRSVISAINWFLGGTIFIIAIWPVASHSAPVVAVATALGATATSIIGYLQAERVLRPVAVAALREGVPEQIHAPGVILRHPADVGAVHRSADPGDRGGDRRHASCRSCTRRPTSCSCRSCCWRSPR